eukprot:3295518-Amphidinium_carterae.2
MEDTVRQLLGEVQRLVGEQQAQAAQVATLQHGWEHEDGPIEVGPTTCVFDPVMRQRTKIGH